jgi:hypothetical protein
MRQQQSNGLGSLFGQMVAVIGGACAIAAIALNSVVPLVIGCVALFCMLSFMNGLGTANVSVPYKPAYSR